MTGHHHLRYTLSRIEGERFVGEVDQYDLDLSTVIRVDGTRSVDQGDAVLYGQAAAGTYLCLETDRQLDIQARRHEFPLSMPADCSVAYAGSGKGDLLTILTFICYWFMSSKMFFDIEETGKIHTYQQGADGQGPAERNRVGDGQVQGI